MRGLGKDKEVAISREVVPGAYATRETKTRWGRDIADRGNVTAIRE